MIILAKPSHIPETIMQFWRSNPTEYTKEDIHHLEPESENAVLLKYLLENGFAKLTIKLNGQEICSFNGQTETDANINLGTLTVKRNGESMGTYNGSENKDINVNLGTLTVQKNGSSVGTYNGSSNKTINVTVPVITYGTGNPSGGNNGDVYMRHQ